MSTKDFFYFSSRNSSFRAIIIGSRNDKNDDSQDKIYKLNRGKFEGINFPVIFKQTAEKKLMDILDTEYAILYLVSDKLKTLLKKIILLGGKFTPLSCLIRRRMK